ncbi:MAG: HNH endonuclease [Anaerolineae bacterium]|nr:HNH endonuclease [Anaerolineae bacterium]MCB0224196.1 HNH endonuclease [Anaerolineae bacterium]MCB9106443.1 HNH endonuclease [Anaerolineales bacterium]
MERVLLLNASYEPLCVVTSRRALALILKGRVEAACGDLLEMQGVSHTLRIPTVIRLRRYINVPRRGARWSRQAVLHRDNHTCGYCGLRAGEKQRHKSLSRSDFTIDHILPISRGGKNTWTNTICACAACNQRKGNRTPHEANMKLGWEPKMPRVTYLVASGQIPASWKVYLEVQK